MKSGKKDRWKGLYEIPSGKKHLKERINKERINKERIYKEYFVYCYLVFGKTSVYSYHLPSVFVNSSSLFTWDLPIESKPYLLQKGFVGKCISL